MVEAICEEATIAPFGAYEKEEEISLSKFHSTISSTYSTSTTPLLFKYRSWSHIVSPKEFKDELHKTLYSALHEQTITNLTHQKLRELGLTKLVGVLGSGAFGTVIELEGDTQKDIAFKIERMPAPIADRDKELFGDALGLKLPDGAYLGNAKALLTYYEGEVHYIENYDPNLHHAHILVGVFSKALKGSPLFGRVHKISENSEAVKGYGKRLAEALHALHNAGYTHNDLHQGNIHIGTPKEGEDPYALTLLDFGLAKKITPEGMRYEWGEYAYILKYLDQKNVLAKDLNFQDLLYSPTRGLIGGVNPYSETEIINHPFFA